MNEFPFVPSPVFRTENGTPYLNRAGVALISKPEVSLEGIRDFLEGFDKELDFPQYLDDLDNLPPGEKLAKFAGQLCYLSFGPKRTKNAEAAKYFKNIKESGHGSVIEHPNYSVLAYGISRSVTHELVRHRAGFGFSQVSQRYVDGTRLRFVQRPEYQDEPTLHEHFIKWIDMNAEEYAFRSQRLLDLQKQDLAIMSGEAKTDLRKKVQQAARSCLANETEAPIVVTANARGWRHFTEMRANPHAETEIRALSFTVFTCLKQVAPIIFDDYAEETLPDGAKGVATPFRKV